MIASAAGLAHWDSHPRKQAGGLPPSRAATEEKACPSDEVKLSAGSACLQGDRGLDLPWLVSGRTARSLMRGTKISHRLPVAIPPGMRGPLGEHWPQDADDRALATWTVTRSSAKLRRWSARVSCPLGRVGATLWTQESWRVGRVRKGLPLLQWRAERGQELLPGDGVWQRPETQPRRFTRLVLEVTDVSVQRLQSLGVDAARSEGFSSVEAFIASWNSTYPEGPKWSDNPWTWVVRFAPVWQRFPRGAHEPWREAAQLDLDLG